MAAAIRIYKILSSKFSMMSSKNVLISLSFILLAPYLLTLVSISLGVPSIPFCKNVKSLLRNYFGISYETLGDAIDTLVVVLEGVQ